MDGQDADSIICVDGKKASLYSLRDKRVLAVEVLRNVPYRYCGNCQKELPITSSDRDSATADQ